MPSEIIPRDGYRPQVLHALVRKRAEIAGQIGHYQTILRGLNVQLDNVDATIRIFNPAVDIGAIRAKPLGPRYAAARGETSRIVFNMLREANGDPITSRDIVLRLMDERGLDSGDKKLKALFATRVRACLSMHTKAGLVRRGEIVNGCQGWEIEK
jgi:hypothetical protein